MNHFFKKTNHLLFIAIFCLFFSFVLCGTAVIKNDQHLGVQIPGDFSDCSFVKLYPNGESGFVLVCSFKNETQLVFLDSVGNYIDSSTINRRTLYSFVDSTHLFLTDLPNLDPKMGNCSVKISDFPIGAVNSDSMYYCVLPMKYQLNTSTFAPTDTHWFYWIDFQRQNTLSAFNPHLEKPSTSIFTIRGKYTSIAVSPDHYLYATYSNSNKIGIRNLNDGVQKVDLPLYDSCIPAYPYYFLNSHFAMDKNGQVYRLSGSPPTFISAFATQGDCKTACIYHENNVLCKTEPHTALEYNSSGEAINQYNFDGELLSFVSNESICIAAVKNGSKLRCVNLNEIKPGKVGELPLESEPLSTSATLPNVDPNIPVEKPNETESNSNPSSQTNSASNNEQESSKNEEPQSQVLSEPAESIPNEFESKPDIKPESKPESKPENKSEEEVTKISSTSYYINSASEIIYIPKSTSYSKLKKNLILGNVPLKIIKSDGTSLTSGNSYVGTGSVLQLIGKSNIIDSLTVIVKGDLTGSGTITSRSEQKLYQHLSSGTSISDFCLLAADIDGNGTVNTADLLLLRRLRTDI